MLNSNEKKKTVWSGINNYNKAKGHDWLLKAGGLTWMMTTNQCNGHASLTSKIQLKIDFTHLFYSYSW